MKVETLALLCLKVRRVRSNQRSVGGHPSGTDVRIALLEPGQIGDNDSGFLGHGTPQRWHEFRKRRCTPSLRTAHFGGTVATVTPS